MYQFNFKHSEHNETEFDQSSKKAQDGLEKLEHLLRKNVRSAEELGCMYREVRAQSRKVEKISN